jgi:NTP pyrophosphatase (non-canonical NTP hydrolase)/cytidylate kinase/acylphosphatase
MKQGSIDYSRNTGVADVDGEIYVNGNDVELLGKLGFEYSENDYKGLEKTSEALDLYSYIEKIAGVPKEVAKLIDAGQAFSGEYLKDMGYKLPKGYEVKGDLVCRVEKTEQSFQQTGKEEKESSKKTAAADPAQTILITGHSGSGKTTLSRQLAEKLGIPVRRVDAHRGWDNYIRGDDKRWKETLTPGTKEHSYFTNLVNRATRDTLKNAPEAGVIEGTQLGHLSPEELAKFKAHVVVGGTRDQSIAQRIQRSVDKASKQGITFSPEEMAAKKIKAEYVANFWEPGVEKFRKLPGVLNYNHSEHQIAPLVEQLKHLMGKEAEYKWHKSKDLHRDVTNGRHYPFSFLTGEAKELVDAIRNRDMANFKEEIGDTSYAAQMLAAQATGLNHPVYADLSKFHNREKIWKDIFREKGSTYHPKHMEGGSNFAKPSKIIKALASAGIRISQKEAEKLANKYTGGKMEKEAAAPTQHYEGESTRPFGGVAGGMSGGVGLQGQSTVRSNQSALRPTPPQLRPMPAQEAPEPVNPAPGSPVGVTNTSPTMSPGTGHVVSTHAPLNVNNVPLGQTNAPSWSDVYGKMKTRPSDFVPDGIAAGVGVVANRIIPGAGLSADLLNKVRRGQAMAQIGVGETSARGKKDDPTGAMIDRIGALGGAATVYPHPIAKAIGYGVQAGAMGLNLTRDYDQARAQLPDTLTEQPVVPPTNYPASNFSIRPEQQAQPSINTGGDLLAKEGMQTQTYKFEGNVQGVHLRKELHNILDKMRRAGLAVNHPETNEVYATLEGRKKYTDSILDKLKKALSERKERPLAYGSDYNISHVPSMQEKLKPVKFTKEHLMAFVKRNAEIKSLQSKAEKDQFDFVGKRYRLKPNQHGELEGMVPGKAYDQLINGAPSYSFQIHPQPDILGKQAASIGSLGRLGKALGVKGYGKVMDVARGAFDNFSSLGKSVPPGALHTERMDALNTGNKLLEDFKPAGFKIYSGRVKTPDSLAGHGNQVTNDLLGFRVTPKNGYGEDSANALADQLRQQGITVTKQKKLVRDGYHGWNIAGEMPGANGNVPVEFQMTPRRMQGVFAADHMYNYKPETSGVNPAVGKYIYKPAISYLTKTMSPMSPMQTRVGYGAAGLTGVGGLGAGAYSLARPGSAAPGVTSARPMAQPNTQPIAMGSPQVNVDTL